MHYIPARCGQYLIVYKMLEKPMYLFNLWPIKTSFVKQIIPK